MVDLERLRGGITAVVNARNLTWRSFAPFEKAKTVALLKSVLPIQIRKILYIDAGSYFLLADSVIRPLLPECVNKSTVMLSLDDVRRAYPNVWLSNSLTGLMTNEHIIHLSPDEQMNFHFFLDCTVHYMED